MPEAAAMSGSQPSGSNSSKRAVASRWSVAASAVIQKQKQEHASVTEEAHSSSSISDSFASRMQDSAF